MATNTARTPGHPRTMFNIVRMYATTAEVGLVNMATLASPGQVNFGFYVQAVTSAIVVSITMEDPEFAMNPANNAQVPWKTFTSLAAQDILNLPFPITVMKLSFAGQGAAYIGYM